MLLIEDATFESQLTGGAPVAIAFFSEWCTTCAETMPILEKLETELAGKLKFCKIDFDENTQSAVNCGVLVVPTVVVFKGGQSVERIVGYQSEMKFREKLAPHISDWR